MLVILSKSLIVGDSASILNVAARLAAKSEEIAFLHIQDACKATASKEYCNRLLDANIKVYALKADVEAQCLTEKTHPHVKIIDYEQWVSLLINGHNRIVSWTS